MVICKGKLYRRGETSLLELTRDLLCDDRTLCPGMLEDFNKLGYKPENIRIMAGPCMQDHVRFGIYPLLVKNSRALQLQGLMHRTLAGNEFVQSA